MATATAKKKKPEAKKELVMVPVGSIDPSPYQSRQVFDEKELGELAETIKTHGLLQKPVVRKKGKRYELIAGERRLRAVKLAQFKTIPVEVIAADDKDAAEMTAIENLQRADLSAIEEARSYQIILDADDTLTETALAKRLGVSQPHIANRLRLLGLPDAVQKRVISREIPPTHARELLAIKDHPKILAEVMKEVDRDIKRNGSIDNVEEFQWTVNNCVADCARQIKGETYDQKSGKKIPHFEPTDEQREQLGIVAIPNRFNDHVDEYATNTKLWNKLQAAHRKEWLAEQNGKSKAKASANGNGKKSNGKPKPLTAAQKKAAKAEEARKAKERAAQFRRRLYGWWVDWQRWLLAEWIREECGVDDLLRLAILLDVDWMRGYQWDRSQRLTALLKRHDLKPKGRKFLGPMFDLEPDNVTATAAGFLAAMFWDGDEPNAHIVPADDVVALAKIFEIDLENAWLADQAGPMSESFWNLHGKDQLLALAKELGVEVKPGKKSDLVASLLAQRPKDSDMECGIDMPAELKKGLKRIGVDIDAVNKVFRLAIMPGDLEAAEASHQSDIERRLQDGLWSDDETSIGIYYGTP